MRRSTADRAPRRAAGALRMLALALLLASVALNGVLIAGWLARDRGATALHHGTPIGEPVVMRTEGGLLEVSVVRAPEYFEATQDHRILGVPVGRTVSRIRVPATYRYHIELAPEWRILLRDGRFVVVAPAVRPSLPVAIDTAQLRAESAGVWSLFTGSAQQQALQRSITEALARKSTSPSYVEFQREAARATVREFVAKWLRTQARWAHAAELPVQVFFADEPISSLRDAPLPIVGAAAFRAARGCSTVAAAAGCRAATAAG